MKVLLLVLVRLLHRASGVACMLVLSKCYENRDMRCAVSQGVCLLCGSAL